MKKNQNRNGMIDLMRFILSIILVIFHGGVGIYTLFNKQIIYFYGGPTAVEFFFLISGYLMAKSINEIRDNNNILKSSYNFFKKKILSFYPAYFICWLVSFILINIFCYNGKKILLIHFFESLFELLLIRNAGFNGSRVMPQTWYISAMILSMLIIFPIYKKYKKYFEGYLAPLISVILLGFLCFKGYLIDANLHLEYFYLGTIRAFSEICLGIFCYFLCEKLKMINFTKLGGVFLSIVEILGYLLCILYMQYYLEFNKNFNYIAIIPFSISIIISFSNKSSVSKLLCGKFWTLLGKFSLYLYLIYYPIVTIVPILFPSYSPFMMLIVYIGLTFLAAFIILCLEKHIIKLFKLLKKLFVKELV